MELTEYWIELDTKGMLEYKEICKTLRQFSVIMKIKYNPIMNDFIESTLDDWKVELVKTDSYEYKVSVRNLTTGDQYTHLHIDGIKEERDKYIKSGQRGHLVFSIACITDIYERLDGKIVGKIEESVVNGWG
jgi:hypothetical protein